MLDKETYQKEEDRKQQEAQLRAVNILVEHGYSYGEVLDMPFDFFRAAVQDAVLLQKEDRAMDCLDLSESVAFGTHAPGKIKSLIEDRVKRLGVK